MKQILIVLLTCVVLNGCVTTTSSTNRLHSGMTKAEVIKVMGNPTSVKAKDNNETLEYLLYPTWSPTIYDKKQQYWVILNNGKVTQYGNAGDYGTAEKADVTIERRY